MERRVPTKEEVQCYLKEDRNWGRWGHNDQKGAVNLVTPEKRIAAARLVQSGLAISLSREFPKTPAPNNPTPAIHYMKGLVRGEGVGRMRRLLRYLIPWHGGDPLGCFVSCMERRWNVERAKPRRDGHYGRGHLGFD